MIDEIRIFIEELIEEIDHLTLHLDGEYSTNFRESEKEREETKKHYLSRLNELLEKE